MKLGDAEARLREVEGILKASEDKAKELEGQLLQVQADFETKQNEVNALNAQAEIQSGDTDAQNAKMKDMDEELERLRALLQAEKEKMEAQNAMMLNLNNQINQLQNTNDKMLQEKDALLQEKNALEVKAEEGEKEGGQKDKDLEALKNELKDVKEKLTDIEDLFDGVITDKEGSALPRMKEIYKFISDMASEKKKRELLIFEAKAVQTEIGGINSANGEIGFEHEHHEIPYEAKKVTVPMKRVKGSEGRASCYWRCDIEDKDSDLDLLGQLEGYVNFEDGEVHSELEIDFEPYVLKKIMKFSITVEDTRGCCLSSELHSMIFFTVNPPENIPKGMGFVEFVKDKYSVETNQTKARILLRRRGSFGRVKKAQIFTRDLSAEEGRDYFTADNDLGLLSFGPAEVYKEVNIRIGNKRGITTRTFKVELGNNEGLNDMKRRYETTIDIKPATFNIGYDSATDTEDVDSIHSGQGSTNRHSVIQNLNFD